MAGGSYLDSSKSDVPGNARLIVLEDDSCFAERSFDSRSWTLVFTPHLGKRFL